MFISLSIVLERMQYEGVVDVFQTVRTLRTQRPAMVQTEVGVINIGGFKYRGVRKNDPLLMSYRGLERALLRRHSNGRGMTNPVCFQDQYQFCYRAALEYLSSFDHYTDQ